MTHSSTMKTWQSWECACTYTYAHGLTPTLSCATKLRSQSKGTELVMFYTSYSQKGFHLDVDKQRRLLLLYLSACLQDVTVPASPHSSLKPLCFCAVYCSAILTFPIPPSLGLPPFFFSLFPSSLPPHYITLALTHYQ